MSLRASEKAVCFTIKHETFPRSGVQDECDVFIAEGNVYKGRIENIGKVCGDYKLYKNLCLCVRLRKQSASPSNTRRFRDQECRMNVMCL